MDVNKTLQELYEERRRLDMAIAGLEARQRALAKISSPGRRGRKTMSEEERRAVSIRMAKYWEARKAAQTAAEPPGPAGANR
ncbi:MAG TPA: hypothetical protein VIX89_07050 [Bryobacteraceae bacterium]